MLHAYWPNKKLHKSQSSTDFSHQLAQTQPLLGIDPVCLSRQGDETEPGMEFLLLSVPANQ